MLPFPQQPRAAPASAAPNSAQHRDALVEEARKRHYQDLPWGTAALGGGLAGLGIPLALVGLTRPDLFRQPSQLAGLLGATTLAGAGTGVGMEALGRVLTRAAGPSFEPKRWHRDQDPHRWNSAVRTAPLIAALLAGRTIPTVLQEIKQAGVVDQDLRARIAAAEAQVEIPTPEQIESGNYRKGHCTVQGLPITLETAKGQTRSGQDKTGKAWSIQLKNSYGYIKRTSSAEIGDQMDIFLGPFPESQIVFVVDQNKTSGKFDEHKSIVGARTSQEAKDIYHANYSPGWKGFRDCTALTMEQFKAWLKHGDMKVPLAGQQFSTFYKKANWDQTLREIQRQLPGLHVPETVAGGVAGAGVGGVAQLLRRIFQSKQDRKQKGTPSILKGMLYGGGAGALAGNLVGDRARRYISNMPNPFGYDLDNQINDIKENGVQGFVDGFIKDKPIHPPGADGMSTSFSRFVRRELLRRGLNLPTDGVGKDIFDEVGKHTDGSPVLNLAGRFFDASGHLKNTAEALQAWNAIKAVDMPKAQKAVENVFTQNVSPTFGHFATKRMGDTVRFLDRWNFDLHPHEDKKLERYGAKLVDHVSQNLSNPSSWTLANALGDTKAKEFKTLTARWLGDHSFANKMPTFDQTFQVPEDIPSLLQNAPM